MLRMKSWSTVTPAALEPTSTLGGAPTTSTVSVRPSSGSSSALRRMVRSMRRRMPPRS
ncbi:hypothetical protein COSO111634_27005 [Corallococcus soli]